MCSIIDYTNYSRISDNLWFYTSKITRSNYNKYNIPIIGTHCIAAYSNPLKLVAVSNSSRKILTYIIPVMVKGDTSII